MNPVTEPGTVLTCSHEHCGCRVQVETPCGCEGGAEYHCHCGAPMVRVG